MAELNAGYLANLTDLNISWCNRLSALPELEKLTQMAELDLSGCSSLTKLSGLESLTQLTKLDFSRCPRLTALPRLDNLKQLTELDFSECSSLKASPELGMLAQLTYLNLSKCSSLTELSEGLDRMVSLRTLDLRYLTLRELPDWLPEIADVFSTNHHSCPRGNKAAVWLFGTTV